MNIGVCVLTKDACLSQWSFSVMDLSQMDVQPVLVKRCVYSWQYGD